MRGRRGGGWGGEHLVEAASDAVVQDEGHQQLLHVRHRDVQLRVAEARAVDLQDSNDLKPRRLEKMPGQGPECGPGTGMGAAPALI